MYTQTLHDFKCCAWYCDLGLNSGQVVTANVVRHIPESGKIIFDGVPDEGVTGRAAMMK